MEPDIAEYRRLHGDSFRDLLAAVPDLADLEIDRPPEPARVVDLPDPLDEDPGPLNKKPGA